MIYWKFIRKLDVHYPLSSRLLTVGKIMNPPSWSNKLFSNFKTFVELELVIAAWMYNNESGGNKLAQVFKDRLKLEV